MSCQITFVSVDVQLSASLTPTALIIRGVITCQNAAAKTLTITTGVTGSPPGSPVTASLNPVTGEFVELLQVTGTIQCDARLLVTIDGLCADNTTCQFSQEFTISCSTCPRAQLSASQAPCVSGSQPVTLNANISIPAGATYVFRWQSGMPGVFSPPFPINNQTGTATTIYAAVPATFAYPPGSYTATLVLLSPVLSECPPLEIPFVAQCPVCCPNLTLTPPQVNGCAPSNALVSFIASLSWPGGCTPIQPTAYIWTVNGPTGQFQNITSTNTTDTSATWTKVGTSPPQVGPVDLSQFGNYSVSVLAQVPGVPAGCYPIGTKPFNVPPCNCPVLTGLTANPPSGTAPLTVNFAASATNPGAIVPDAQGNLYHWDFGDGTTADTPTANTSHTYANAGTFAVTVTVNVPSGCSATSKATSVTVTQPPSCPVLTGLTANPSSGTAPLTVNFAASATNPGAIVPDAQGNLYHWDFGDGTTADTPTANTSHTYANAGTFAVTVTVNVPSGCSATSKTTSVTVTTAPPTDGGFNFCAALLVAAIALLLLGGVLIIIGVCFSVPLLVIVGAIVAGIGLLLFILWAVFCAAFTSCSVMQTVHCILFLIIAVVAPIIVLLAFFFGSLPCFLAAAGAWGGWGTLYAWLGFIMGKVGCARTC